MIHFWRRIQSKSNERDDNDTSYAAMPWTRVEDPISQTNEIGKLDYVLIFSSNCVKYYMQLMQPL